MWAILGRVFGEVLRSFYKEWRARRDVKLLERFRLSREAQKNDIKALRFKLDAIRDGTDADTRMQHPEGDLLLPGEHPDPKDTKGI